MFTSPKSESASRKRSFAALATLPLLLGILAACSAAPGADGPKSGASQSVTDEQAFEAWNLEYRACMSDKGIDMGDDPNSAVKLDQPDFEAISEACLEQVGEPPAAPGGEKSQEEIEQAALKFAECMRGLGYDIEDPVGNGISLPENANDADVKKCSAESDLLGPGGE